MYKTQDIFTVELVSSWFSSQQIFFSVFDKQTVLWELDTSSPESAATLW